MRGWVRPHPFWRIFLGRKRSGKAGRQCPFLGYPPPHPIPSTSNKAVYPRNACLASPYGKNNNKTIYASSLKNKREGNGGRRYNLSKQTLPPDCASAPCGTRSRASERGREAPKTAIPTHLLAHSGALSRDPIPSMLPARRSDTALRPDSGESGRSKVASRRDPGVRGEGRRESSSEFPLLFRVPEQTKRRRARQVSASHPSSSLSLPALPPPPSPRISRPAREPPGPALPHCPQFPATLPPTRPSHTHPQLSPADASPGPLYTPPPFDHHSFQSAHVHGGAGE